VRRRRSWVGRPTPSPHSLNLFIPIIVFDVLSSLNCRLLPLFAVEYIDVHAGELTRADAFLKQKIKFGEGTSSRLGYTEVGVDDAEETNSTLVIGRMSAFSRCGGAIQKTYPEKRGELLPIPSGRVDHVRSKDRANDPDNVTVGILSAPFFSSEIPYSLGTATHCYGLDQEPSTWDLPYEGVAHGPNGQLIECCPTKHDPSGCERSGCRVLVRHEGKTADCDEHNEETAEPVQIEGASADA
jgi:hypothetical protein